MESGNACDFSHLDEGVRVPPRKRLLAGFKKQNSSDQSCGSTSASPPSTGTEADTCAKNLLSIHSLEEIAESSNKAALATAKVADAARTVAEEKAAIAARAIAAAKTALDLVAAFYEETTGRDSRSKKNMSKRQAKVHSLYEKEDEIDNEVTVEEQIHQVIYRSRGLSKHSSSSSDLKSLKHNRPRFSHAIEKTKIPYSGIFGRDSRAMFYSDAILDAEGSSHEVAYFGKDRCSSITKLVSSSWRTDNKDIVTQRGKARKQLIQMV